MLGVRHRRSRSLSEHQAQYSRIEPEKRHRGGLPVKLAFVILLSARLVSTVFNIVHDCDEVYNYWEPLHYLLYGYGMQTWEYSAEFALRSYLYLLLHSPVAVLGALLTGASAGKQFVFYGTKAFLGLVSACSEVALYRETRNHVGPGTAHLLLVLLVSSCGMFTAATSLLPSSFAMYMVTWAAAGVLKARPSHVVVPAVLCVTLGWPVAGVALLPYALYVLFARGFLKSLGTAIAALIATLGPLVLVDRLFYGRWTVSLWNFVRYNVAGGGDSALYGVESPDFYLRNGALNLNVALPLALVAPALLFLRSARKTGAGLDWRLMVALGPVWAWLAAISALPHKEERFLYVVYPLVCLGAAAALAALRQLIFRTSVGWLPRRVSSHLAVWIPFSLLALSILLSAARATALVKNYSAPMKIYGALPQIPAEELAAGRLRHVCVGDEWHRFPSAFLLPSPGYRLAFVKSGFNGLLPRPFSFEEGGTAAASGYLNDRNREEPANYWPTASQCSYLVELRKPQDPPRPDAREWRVRAALPFVLAAESPASARVLYIPWYSRARNQYAQYVLSERVAP